MLVIAMMKKCLLAMVAVLSALVLCVAPAGYAEGGTSSSLTVHFIDVGQADAALVLCDGEAMLIDGGNKEDSSLIYTYLTDLAVDHLAYIVCTHPHEDHLGGLPAALNAATVDHALSPVSSFDSDLFFSFTTYLERQGVPITVPSPGDSFPLGNATVEVLGPAAYDPGDLNDSSIVLRVTYGSTAFLFTGDCSRDEEQAILDSGMDIGCTVLKVGHHGSDTSTSYPFLLAASPRYAVISVGANNGYGHPAENTLSRLRDADVEVYRTDLQGDVICTSDGTAVTFTVERDPDIDTLAPVGPNSVQSSADADLSSGTEYILNTRSHKFHYLECPAAAKMSEKNKLIYQGTRDEVIAMGYDPCGWCDP